MFYGLLQKKAMQKIPFESDIQHVMKSGNVPGMSIAVIENGEIASHQEYSVKNAEARNPIEESTVFEAAFCTVPHIWNSR